MMVKNGITDQSFKNNNTHFGAPPCQKLTQWIYYIKVLVNSQLVTAKIFIFSLYPIQNVKFLKVLYLSDTIFKILTVFIDFICGLFSFYPRIYRQAKLSIQKIQLRRFLPR